MAIRTPVRRSTGRRGGAAGRSATRHRSSVRQLVALAVAGGVVVVAAVIGGVLAVGSRNSHPIAVPLTAIPTAYRSAIVRAGHTCSAVSPGLIAAQLDVESGFDPQAVSGAGAQGIAQFVPATWQTWGLDADHNGSASPFDPYDGIATAARYDCHLAHTLGHLPGSTTEDMLAAYNAGPHAVESAGGPPPYAETAGYVSRILLLAPRYSERLHPTSVASGS